MSNPVITAAVQTLNKLFNPKEPYANHRAPYFIHRSGTETLWTCPRKFALEYLVFGTGIRRTPTKLQLTVGSAVHAGLAVMCVAASQDVKVALSEDCAHVAIREAVDYFVSSDTYASLKEHERREQETLIAGLLWSFFYYSWPLFCKTYEVVCVERAWVETFDYGEELPLVHLSSRPDVIVRHRLTNEFIGISWKTIDDLNEYKRWNYRENLQNFMETFYGEKLLAKVLDEEYEFTPEITGLRGKALVAAMEKEIAAFKLLPREIAYVQTVFLVKGPRQCQLNDGTEIAWEFVDDYSSEERTFRQASLLCYRYLNGGMTSTSPAELEETLVASLEELKPGKGRKKKETAPKKLNLSADVSWSFRYWKKGNKSYNNLSGDWMRQPIWESDISIQEWVQQLNAGVVFPSGGSNPDERNLANPLSKVVIWDAPVERREALMSSSMSDVERSHYAVIANSFQVDEKTGEYVLDLTSFDRHLNACNNSAPSAGVPVKCEYLRDDVCFGSDVELLVQIGGSSEWQKRRPHHQVELESFEERGLL